MNALDKIEKASQKQEGTVTGIPTGFIDLDYKTSGFQPSDLILIAARPSMGKTAFRPQCGPAYGFQEKERPYAIFSLEMSKGTAGKPSLLPWNPGWMPRPSEPETLPMRTGRSSLEGAAVVGKSNLIIDDTPGISIAELRSKCRKFKLEHDLGIIIIDYLQLMSGGKRFRVPPAGDLRDFPILKSRGPRTQRAL